MATTTKGALSFPARSKRSSIWNSVGVASWNLWIIAKIPSSSPPPAAAAPP